MGPTNFTNYDWCPSCRCCCCGKHKIKYEAAGDIVGLSPSHLVILSSLPPCSKRSSPFFILPGFVSGCAPHSFIMWSFVIVSTFPRFPGCLCTLFTLQSHSLCCTSRVFYFIRKMAIRDIHNSNIAFNWSFIHCMFAYISPSDRLTMVVDMNYLYLFNLMWAQLSCFICGKPWLVWIIEGGGFQLSAELQLWRKIDWKFILFSS